LFNPNPIEVNLTGWYLQRKTQNADSWSSLVSSTKFEGKTISPKGYFLIGNETEGADILLDFSLSENNSLVLKNPKRGISDELGFGNAPDFERFPSVNFEDNKSLSRKLDEQGCVDSNNNLEDFEIDQPTPRNQNIKWVEPESEDKLPPQVTFNLNPTQANLSFIIDFTITDLASAVSPSGLKSYAFRWKDGESDWQEDEAINVQGSPESADFAKDFKGENGKKYYFQVRATDAVGNSSDWLPENPASTIVSVTEQKPILITEAQIEGANVYQDFIKLYNPNDFDFYLKGFRLVKRAETSPGDTTIKSWANDSVSKIGPKNYFIWASSVEPTYPASIQADVFTQQSISPNNGIGLRFGLENSGNLIDALGWGNFDNVLLENQSYSQNPKANQILSRIKIDGVYQDVGDNSIDFSLLDTTTQTDL
jgi:hypothetical protein